MVDHAPAVDAPIPKVSAKSQANGKMVAINEPKRLTVHVFGSHTGGPFSRQAGSLQKVYDAFGKKVDFLWVYTKEAHASDGSRPARHVEIPQHQTIEDRRRRQHPVWLH